MTQTRATTAADDGPGPGTVGRRQFLLSEREVEAPSWFVHERWGQAHLYRCPSLPVLRLAGPDGTDRVLLGVALPTGGTLPEEDMARLDGRELEAAYRRWSGRWVLLSDGEVHPDAFAMLSVYYLTGAVASSPAVLPGAKIERTGFRPEHLLSYHPGPTTGIPAVRRVLPGEVLSWTSGVVRSRRLPEVREVEEAEAGSLVDELAEVLLAEVRSAARLGEVVVPLTAGYDSRLVLAACVAAGVGPRLITQAYPSMSEGDRRLPPLMAGRLGLEHELVRPGKRNAEAGRRYDDQVAGLVRERDRDFVERGQFGWLHEGDVVLRGIMFDGTRSGYGELLSGVELNARQLAEVFGATPDQEAALAIWVRGVHADPQTLRWDHRFWFDQKCASYAAVSETALDLFAPHSVMPGNSVRYQELALSLPWVWRRESRHHRELVARWAPEIADVPYNPPRGLTSRAARIPGALQRRVRTLAALARGLGSH